MCSVYCSLMRTQTYAKSPVRSQAAECHDVQTFLSFQLLLPTAHGTNDDVIEVRCVHQTHVTTR